MRESQDRLVDLTERRQRTSDELDARLLQAYEDAKRADDGRRVALADLPRPERKRL